MTTPLCFDKIVVRAMWANSNQLFIIITVLRRSVQRVAKSISAAQRLNNTAPKKHRSGDEELGKI